MKFEKAAEKLYSKLEEKDNGYTVYYCMRQVYPVLNRDGTINWFNFITGGNFWKLAGAILFIIIVLGFIWEYHINIQAGADCLSRENLAKNITISYSDLSCQQEAMRLSPNFTRIKECQNEP